MITAPVRAIKEEHKGQDASSYRGDKKTATSHKNAVSCIKNRVDSITPSMELMVPFIITMHGL